MKVILTEDVVGVGDIGEAAKVKAGYARNFLIPRGMAFEATSGSAKQIAHKMKQIDAKKSRLKGDQQKQAEKLEKVKVELSLRVGSGGKVFGSISAKDISAQLAELGYEIDRRRVLLGDPIRKIGERKVEVKLHPEVVAEITVVVAAISATKEQEAQETTEAKEALEAAADDFDSEDVNEFGEAVDGADLEADSET